MHNRPNAPFALLKRNSRASVAVWPGWCPVTDDASQRSEAMTFQDIMQALDDDGQSALIQRLALCRDLLKVGDTDALKALLDETIEDASQGLDDADGDFDEDDED